MSLFEEYETTCSVYQPTDSDSTKISNYPTSATFTIKMHIIRRNEDTIALAGQEVGEYIANVQDSYTNASNIARGDKVVDADGKAYIVINKPKYVKLFKRYKVMLNTFE